MAEAEAEECPPGLSWPTIACILSYGGDARDVAINYSLLCVSSAAALVLLLRTAPSSPRSLAAALRWQAAAFAAVTAFQLGLCMVLGCAGISIIWNATNGFMWQQLASKAVATQLSKGFVAQERPKFSFLISRDEPASAAVVVSLVLGLAADVYYAVTNPLITTIAHLCALALGAGIGVLYSRE
ncbi:hypothetical protein AB1Y20_005567 [Prymnesium parvum]|uniref:Uncharacterized protein n=1 Tax=Prymnesium parvum TaxID=97485 RepID=A0AB34J6J9_PRYPA|mmetsp:Transcript_36395/g.90570  ORF Transcript_36395/g.90570 Transcript_36395/m.90570 type:complete len:184 (+) Transcript_36395:21-572(+)